MISAPASLLACRPSRWAACLLVALTGAAETPAASTSDADVKAVLLFNFTQFVDWPPAAFATVDAPLVIGVLGRDPFGPALDGLVRGERAAGRPIAVRRCDDPDGAEHCHVLFVPAGEEARFARVRERLNGRSILTVGDAPDFIAAGGMVQIFRNRENRLRLRINRQAAQECGLVVSAKLLRVAEVVRDERS